MEILSHTEWKALLKQTESALKKKKQQHKAASTDALREEVRLLDQQVKQLRFGEKFSLVHHLSGLSEDLATLKPLLPKLKSLPLAWFCYIGVDLNRRPEGIELFLVVKGSFRLEPGLLPGVVDVLQMRFYSFEAKATHETIEGALEAATQLVKEKMTAHEAYVST